LLIFVDIIDKIGATASSHSSLLFLYNKKFFDQIGNLVFLAHNDSKLYFDSGNEKLNNSLIQFKETVFKLLIKLSIYSEWSLNLPD
jgi:hypothetical protein